MMNWAKKLLAAGDCPRCGGRLEDLGDGQASCDTCSYPEPEEPKYSIPACNCPLHNETDDGTVHCDDCEYLCGDVCGYHDPEEAEPDDEDDPPQYCDLCGNVIPDGETWCLDVRGGTEHFCSAECQHERAAEIEAAPLCAWCHEKCDQGVVNSVHSPDNSAPFCSTECLEKFRASSATGRCDDCGRDGECATCPGHPKGDPVNPFDPGDVPFVPFHADSEIDRCFLESDFGKASIPLVATTGWRAARQNGKTYYPAFDRTVWYRENGYWKRGPSRW